MRRRRGSTSLMPSASSSTSRGARFGAAERPAGVLPELARDPVPAIGGVNDAVVVLQKPGVETFAPLAFWPEGIRERPQLGEIDRARAAEGAACRAAQRRRQAGARTGLPDRLPGAGRRQAARRGRRWRSRGATKRSCRPRCASCSGARAGSKCCCGATPIRWRRRGCASSDAASSSPRCSSRSDFRDAATALATELATRLGCDRVALGVARARRACTWRRVSHAGAVRQAGQPARARPIGAMAEALDQRETVVYPLERDAPPRGHPAHAELAQASRRRRRRHLPLAARRRQVGALTLERPAGMRFDAATVELCEGLAAMLGPVLELQAHARPRPAAHAARDRRAALAPARRPAPRRLQARRGAASALSACSSPSPTATTASPPTRASRARCSARSRAPFQGYVARGRARAPATRCARARCSRARRPRPASSSALQLGRASATQLGQQVPRGDGQPAARAVRVLERAARAGRGAARAGRRAARAHRDRRAVRRRGGERRPVAVARRAGRARQGAVRAGAARRLPRDHAGRRARHRRRRASGRAAQLALSRMPHDRAAARRSRRSRRSARSKEGRNFFRVEARVDRRHRQAPAAGHGGRRQDRGRRAASSVWIWTRDSLIDWVAALKPGPRLRRELSRALLSPSWYRVAALRPRLRAHAAIHRHAYRGEIWYVLQDHASRRSHRFSPAAHHFIGLMDGQRTVQEIWEPPAEQLGDDAPTQDEVIRLLGQLHAADVTAVRRAARRREVLRRTSAHRAGAAPLALWIAARAALPALRPRPLPRPLAALVPAGCSAGSARCCGSRWSARAACWRRTHWTELTEDLGRPRARAAEPAAPLRWSSRWSRRCTSSATPTPPRPGAARCTKWASCCWC